MTLMLHCGAEPIDYPALRDIQTPEPTHSHVPIPHHRLVDMVRHTLGFYGHTVISENHGVTPDGMRYFGVMMLKSAYGGYEDAVALRNSHDKRFPIGIGFGGHVFCCDNMSLMADHVIRRKHAANAKRDLPGLVAEVVEPLADVREKQERAFRRYRQTALSWLLSEVYPDDPDIAFGLCDLGAGFPELGDVRISEIEAVCGPWGLPVERDRHFLPKKPLSAYAREARAAGHIIA